MTIALHGQRIDSAQLRELALERAHFTECNFEGLVLDDLALPGSMFGRCKLRGARLRNTLLSDSNWLECDLADVDMTGTNLSGAIFNQSILSGASFQNVDGSKLEIFDSEARGSRWDHALLRRTVFDQVDLRGARFTNAVAQRTWFEKCDLRAASVDGLELEDVKLAQCKVQGISGVPREPWGIVMLQSDDVELAQLLLQWRTFRSG